MIRAQGIADIFMYIFVLFLLVITLAVSGIAPVFNHFKGSSFTIESLQSRHVFHAISIERSALSTLEMTSYQKIPFSSIKNVAPPLSGTGLVGVAATQAATGTVSAPLKLLVQPESAKTARIGGSALRFEYPSVSKATPVEIGLATQPYNPSVKSALSTHVVSIPFPGYYEGAPRTYVVRLTAKDNEEVKWDATS